MACLKMSGKGMVLTWNLNPQIPMAYMKWVCFWFNSTVYYGVFMLGRLACLGNGLTEGSRVESYLCSLYPAARIGPKFWSTAALVALEGTQYP